MLSFQKLWYPSCSAAGKRGLSDGKPGEQLLAPGASCSYSSGRGDKVTCVDLSTPSGQRTVGPGPSDAQLSAAELPNQQPHGRGGHTKADSQSSAVAAVSTRDHGQIHPSGTSVQAEEGDAAPSQVLVYTTNLGSNFTRTSPGGGAGEMATPSEHVRYETTIA